MVDYQRPQSVGMNSELVTHDRKDSGIMPHTRHKLFGDPWRQVASKPSKEWQVGGFNSRNLHPILWNRGFVNGPLSVSR